MIVVKPNIVLFMVDDLGWQDTSVSFWTEETNSIGFIILLIWKYWLKWA